MLLREAGEDRRQQSEFGFIETREARETQAVDILAPGTPEVLPSPTLPPTITPAPTMVDEQASPEQAVIAYYEALNNDEFLEAWARLSDDFQFRFNDNDFDSYRAFWMSAGQVSVVEVVLEDQPNQFEAILLVSIYWESDRRIRSNRYSMVLDLAREIWLINVVSAVE